MQVVDPAVLGGCHSSLALDSKGGVHIAYLQARWNGVKWVDGALRYATNATGNWEIAVLETQDERGHSTSIAIDAANAVHISYLDWSTDSLRYLTNASGEWVFTTVDTWVQYYNSLGLDASGVAHLAYYRGHPSTGHLSFASIGSSDDWSTVTADLEDGTGSFASMVLDGNGTAHISHYGIAEQELRYTTNQSGDWATTSVDSDGTTGWYTSVAVDNDGWSHISYSNLDYELRHATNEGGTWSLNTVDSNTDGVDNTSIVVDSADTVHIAYTAYYPEWPESELRYAVRRGDSWATEIVEKDFQTGNYPSLVVDEAGTTHIAYCNGQRNQLRYTNRPASD